MTAAISQPCSRRRWRSPTMRASRRARREVEEARPAARPRHLLRARAFRRRADRRRADVVPRRRQDDLTMHRADRPARAMPRSSRAWSPSGSASRPSRSRHRARRHRPRDRGLRLGRLALGDDRRHAMVKTRRGDAGQGQEGRGRSAGSRRRPTSNIKDGAFDVVGTDRRISLFDVAARAKEMKKQGEIAEDLDTKVVDRDAAHLPQRLPHRRGRDRSRHRPSRLVAYIGGRRLRQHPRPHHRRRARCMARSRMGSARR